MKILLSFEGRVRPDSTGFHLLNALRSIGHDVKHLYPDDALKVRPGEFEAHIKCDDGIYSAWNHELRNSHYFIIDSHIETGFRKKILNEGNFDTASVVHSQGLAVDWGRDDIYWLPVGCTPEWNYAGSREKKFDGCAIMNFHNGLAGPRVEMLDVFFKSTPKIFFGSRTYKDMAEKYAESKLVFNRSINSAGGEGPNMRFFEALCSGSCLVTDRVADLESLGFIDGVHFAGYSDGVELKAVTESLLRDDERRETIAAAGRAAVLAKHTYAHRMETLLKRLNLHEKEKKEHVNA